MPDAPAEAVETPASAPAAQVAETPAAQPTLAETERTYRETFDKSRGRDVSKLFPQPAKPEAPVTPQADAKPVEAKPAEPEKKPDAPAEVLTRADRDLGKVRARLARERSERVSERTALEERIKALESRIATPVVTEEPAAPVEPTRDQFQTDAEYFAAVRKFDKEALAAESKKISEQRTREDAAREWNLRIEDFNTRLAASKAKPEHKDWDTVVANTKVQFNPILQGVLISADTDLLYHFATHPRDARRLNEMDETAVVATGNADDVTSVLKYLSSHPEDIDTLNGLNPVKAQKFIGRLEAKIEAELKAVPPEKADEAKPDDKRTSLGAPVATPAKADPGADATRETALKAKPEPPPKLNGAAPSTSDWREPAEMSFSERERLYREDPRNRKR